MWRLSGPGSVPAGFSASRVSATAANRATKEAALERLQTLVAEALAPVKQRHATAPTRKSEESRIAAKKRRSRIKRLRALQGLGAADRME